MEVSCSQLQIHNLQLTHDQINVLNFFILWHFFSVFCTILALRKSKTVVFAAWYTLPMLINTNCEGCCRIPDWSPAEKYYNFCMIKIIIITCWKFCFQILFYRLFWLFPWGNEELLLLFLSLGCSYHQISYCVELSQFSWMEQSCHFPLGQWHIIGHFQIHNS